MKEKEELSPYMRNKIAMLREGYLKPKNKKEEKIIDSDRKKGKKLYDKHNEKKEGRDNKRRN